MSRSERNRSLSLIHVLLLAWAVALAPAASAADAAHFRFSDLDANSLGLWEGNRPVLVYNHGVLNKEGVPADRARSTYIHPLYGLDGEVLTDDFPKDHHHHRGLFWAWPHVGIDGKEYDLWMLQGIEQRFERWLTREARADQALLGVENGWYVGARKVMQERLWLKAHPANDQGRLLDLDFTWIPVGKPIALAGAEGKSYGGLTLRYAPRTNTVITTPQGNQPDDLYMTRLPWADLSARFADRTESSGATLFVAPDHPNYPPMWLTRHYGVLCLGWPGVEAKTFAPDIPIRCRYRVWVHRGTPDQAALERLASEYQTLVKATAERRPSPAARAGSAAPAPLLRAEAKPDRVVVYVGDRLFTEYRFTAEAKYPHFYPVNGPRTGRSVTTCQTEPYPHHSSLFFGCDRVNGGNYWQEGLERGRIVSRQVRVVRDAGPAIELEQECHWERAGAEPPFADRRHIVITAPSPDRRVIDFDVTLTAQTKVRIEKSNHALFAARMAPELAVTGGGILVNAGGDQGEKGTFGKPAAWADARGGWDGETEGVTIFSHPANRWSPAPWFTRDYGFLSPTPMFWLDPGAVEFPPGETLRLRYRVLVHSDAPTLAELEAEYQAWSR